MTGDGRRLAGRRRRAVERAVDAAEEATGLQICIHLGRTDDDDPRAHAERLFVNAGLVTRPAVLILVDPRGRRVEVVTAPSVTDRVDDAACGVAVERMTRRFASGDLAGGLVAGVWALAEAAGPGVAAPGAEELPDLLDE